MQTRGSKRHQLDRGSDGGDSDGGNMTDDLDNSSNGGIYCSTQPAACNIADAFMEVIMEVPALALACCSALEDSKYPHREASPLGCLHGLRALRYVCKALRNHLHTVAATKVTIRTSLVGGGVSQQAELFAFLRHTSLSHLEVEMIPGK